MWNILIYGGAAIILYYILYRGGGLTFTDPIQDKIYKQAIFYKIPPELAFGVIALESNFKTDAYRNEPEFWARYIKGKHNEFGWTGLVDNPNVWGSYGLCQILYSTAIGVGYRGQPEGLYDVDTNLRYGLLYLKGLYEKYNGSIMDVLAAYNSGKPYDKAPEFTRNEYIPLVLDRINRWKNTLSDLINAARNIND